MLRSYLQNDLFEGIISRKEFETLVENNLIPKNTNVIAIIDPGDSFHNVDTVLFFDTFLQLAFWDIEEDIGKFKAISDKDAKDIRSFIEEVKNNGNKFLIHCSGGVSRSSAIALAVEYIVRHNGDAKKLAIEKSDITNHLRYEPNLTVFRKIMEV